MNLKLNRAIRQILLAGTATALAAGVMSLSHAGVGVQIQPPGPGQVPDYFGVSSNYATSPAPNFALVTISAPTGAGGRQAVAAATTTDYLNPSYALSPVGMYTKNLMDVQLADGGAGYVAASTTVTVTGNNGGATPYNVNLTPIIVNGVIAGFNEIPHGAIVDNTNPAAPVLISAAWPKDAITGQYLYPTGATLFGTTTVVSGQTWSGLGVDPAGIVAAPNNFALPIAGTGIRKFVNAVSLPGVTNGLGQTLTIADPLAYTNPFVDNLGNTTADYYEIAEVSYVQKLHSDLPPTHLRGYIQLVPSTYSDANGLAIDITDPSLAAEIQTSAASGKYFIKRVPTGTNYMSYLGPVISASKNRPVRVKAVNLLPINTQVSPHAGELPFPVDHTYMGAGTQDGSGLWTADMPDTRTAVHLHGGTTPWISDGTPRQWFTPSGEAVSRGISATDVPDMWYDANGNLLPNSATCTQGSTVCTTAGAKNNPGAGALTFYWSNEESARLMFYHDHAEGITRLNVYDGLAAGYLLTDDTEKAMTHGSLTSSVTYANQPLAPVTYSQVLPEDVIPLVIQEKTFVPDNKNPVLTFYGPFRSQLNAQDPTWRWGSTGAGNTQGSWDGVTGQYVVAGQFPALAAATAVANQNGPGDLWVPHVYMTNQNPGDVSGANPQGRWDYGVWFWPPHQPQHPEVTNPYYDPSCTSATAASNPVGTCEFQYIPGFPNGGQMPATTQAASCAGVQGKKGISVTSCTATGLVSPGELAALGQPSATPEAFNDTAMVNGTVYPFMTVEPKKYRLRLLTAGNDRTWNLSMWVASSKDYDTTSNANIGATSAAANGATCNGSTTSTATVSVLPQNCTEVRMVPWDSTQNLTSKFPTWWYSPLKGGITFDGRPGGVPDPKLRGPAMVQIGTEGGFLATPATIGNQPINYEYNVKNIQVTNVKEHALLLGAAERADVVVDFSQFAGSTIIMYNDAPAALPAFDLRLDYFTGNFDNTDTGGNFSTVPGYGPNTRTVMQFRVNPLSVGTNGCTSANCGTGINRKPAAAASTHQDDVDTTTPVLVNGVSTPYMTALTNQVQQAFKYSQEPIVVPQAVYNSTYGTNVVDATSGNQSAIGDTALNFAPFVLNADGSLALQAPLVAGGSPVPQLDAATQVGMGPKAIQELFTADYGRMNATLGVEIPNTTGLNQTTIPMGYVEPPTELVQMTNTNSGAALHLGNLADGTQIWKITHNGVDTHPVHFHLFSVQVVNRVGWDGAIYPPEPNEVGWKEVVRMNPLADVIVALRPKDLNLPFKLGNSHHLADATQLPGSSANQPKLTPIGGTDPNITNQVINYGWEYVWHCHILGHEENDFMRSIAVAVPPEAPTATMTAPAAPAATDTSFSFTFKDNSVVANWAQLQRDVVPTFDSKYLTTQEMIIPECTSQSGCTSPSYAFTDATAPANTSVYYRVVANSTVGAGDNSNLLPAAVKTLTNQYIGFENVTAGTPSATFSRVVNPIASVLPNPLNFGTIAINTTLAQAATVSNTGAGVLLFPAAKFPATATAFNVTGANATDFAISANTCANANVPAAGNCAITVTFAPKLVGAKVASLTIATNDPANPTLTLPLSGTAGAPIAGVAPTSVAFANQLLGTTSAVTPVTVTNSGTAPLTFSNIAVSGAPYAIAAGGTCSTATPLTNVATPVGNNTCTVNLTFAPTVAGAAPAGTLTFTDNSTTAAGVANPIQVVNLSGTGVVATATVGGSGAFSTTQLVGIKSAESSFVVTNTTGQSIALASTPATITGTDAGQYAIGTNTCAGATLAATGATSTCTVGVTFTPTTAGAKVGTLNVALPNSGVTQTVNLTGTGVVATGTLSGSGAFSTTQLLNTTAGPNTITFTNTTGQAITLAAAPVTITGTNANQFAFTSNCAGTTLAATGATSTCTVGVTFTPTTAGAKVGTLNVALPNSGVTQTLVLSGTGVSPAPLALSGTSLTFTGVIGTQTAGQWVTLTNSGAVAAPLPTGSIVVTAPFARTTNGLPTGVTNCGTSLAAGATCGIGVRMTATDTANSGTLTITSSVQPATSPLVVKLSGTATVPVNFTGTGAFGNLPTGTTRTFTLSNNGNVNMTGVGITIPTGFTQTATTCTATLNANSACTVTVALSTGVQAGNLVAVGTYSAAAYSQSIGLSGTGVVMGTASPASLAFGNQTIGSSSAAQTVTVTNTGASNLTNLAFVFAGQYARSTTTPGSCGTSLAMNATCTVNVVFAPTSTGVKNGTLTVRGRNALITTTTSFASVGLTGTGQ